MQEAVNAAYLREKAEKCVLLASCISDPKAIAALRKMAMEYRIEANLLDALSETSVQQPKMEPPLE